MSRQLGRYELLRPIGRGGMAEIWLGRRRGAGGIEKRVVIKRILRERVRDPRFLGLFVSEAQISMALAHKNIVPMFDFGRVDDELFLVMEFIDGPNWSSAMTAAKKKEAPPHPTLVSHVIFEACQALDYAHNYKDHEGEVQRIAHRDVTPGNLLLSFTGEVKLGDFGLAAATAGLSEGEGTARGTPGYMAPEQARGELVGPPADVFSLGLILHEALTLTRVRTGSADEQIAMASAPLPPLPDHLPLELRDICEKATELAIEDRFESAQAMAEELDNYLLKARSSESEDRRPMNARVADWLKVILPDGLKTGTLKASKKKDNGQAITYLEHGTKEVLEVPEDATMRSMAATALEEDEAGVETADLRGRKSDDQNPAKADSIAFIDTAKVDQRRPPEGYESAEDEEEHNESGLKTVGSPPRQKDAGDSRDKLGDTTEVPRHRRYLAPTAVALALGAGALIYVMTGEDSVAPAIDASLPLVQPAIDARTAPPDAAPDDAALPDAAPPDARTARPRRVDAGPRRPANATLQVGTTPWATVQVIGRPESCDETPCQIKLPAGSYRIKMVNPASGLGSTISVTLKANEVTKVKEVLRPPTR